MFRALKYLKSPTVMVRFPGETHELSRSGEPLAPRRAPPAHRRLVRQVADGQGERHLRRAQRPSARRRAAPAPAPRDPGPPTRADILRGEYGRYRANNDLLYYHLDVRVDPEKKFISGKNTIRFKMLKDDTRIQLDLYANLNVDKILLGDDDAEVRARAERRLRRLSRDARSRPRPTRSTSTTPARRARPGRFGGIAFRKDPAGRHWINTACEGEGASIWWPNKDQWRDEVESMDISVAIPNDLVDVSNGHFVGKTDLGDGYTRWDWHVHYPINNYNVSLNIGNYVHFADQLGDLHARLLRAARRTSRRPRSSSRRPRAMLEAFQHYFGEYPFKKDGYKLIEVPYSGMEHQSAVTYGNRFANGYLERDWTGVGISPQVRLHHHPRERPRVVRQRRLRRRRVRHVDSRRLDDLPRVPLRRAHVRPRRRAEVHERLQVEGRATASRSSRQRGIHRDAAAGPCISRARCSSTRCAASSTTTRRWWKLMRDFYQHFKYQNIMTEDMVAVLQPADSGRT